MMWLRLMSIALVGVMAACAPTRPQPVVPAIRFDQLPTLALNVARVDVRNLYTSPLADPHVEHFAPTTPVNAVRRWVDDRLRAVGRAGELTVIIDDARITEETLPRTSGLSGLVTRDQTERYNGRLRVRLEAQRDLQRGTFEATVERIRTIAEGATLAERELLLQEMTLQMAQDLNMQLEAGLRDVMGAFLARAP